MLEPSQAVILKARYTPYPAVVLQSDEGRVLRPSSVILRHRHLKQQFTIVPPASRQGLPLFAPSQRTDQLPPTSVVAAVVPPVAVHPAAALPVGVALSATSVHIPSAIGYTSGSSVAVPPASGSSATVPQVLPAHPSIAARTGDASSAAPPPANLPGIAVAEIPPAMHSVSSGKTVDASSAPLPVQVTRRNISRSHEIVETGDSSLVVRRAQRAIRDKKGQTTWFYSNGQTYLLDPPLLERAQLGDLYVHTAANRDQQIWIFTRDSRWERIQLYHPHPVLSDYVLHRVSDGEPRWVQKTTVTTYRGREKRYRQMCAQRGAEAAPTTSSGKAARLGDIL